MSTHLNTMQQPVPVSVLEPVPEMMPQFGRVDSSGNMTTAAAAATAAHSMHQPIKKKSTDTTSIDLATNGVSATPPSRASPIPQNGSFNGIPASPHVERSNNMAIGPSTPSPQTVSSRDPKAAAAAASDMRNIVRRKLTGFVGFANLPNQWHRKSVRKGFNFNVMVVGTSNPPPDRPALLRLLTNTE